MVENSFWQDRIARFKDVERRYQCVMLIYGSLATGRASTSSDVDIVIVVGMEQPTRAPALMGELEQLFGRKIDLAHKSGLCPLLRERILGEAISIERLVAGERSMPLRKSWLYYLFIIQAEALKIKHDRAQGGQGVHWIVVLAKRLSHFYENRYLPLAPRIVDKALPLKQIREIARLSRRMTDRNEKLSRYTAAIKRHARVVSKGLRLTRDDVLRDLRG
ncbi:nucleotidyltransferase family protein [Undibacterium sp.]|jgi:predicted nucleotidyltransferase|uniref:nucleotidyltransferase family protein n=1 Tax=Undibacterium sp. TaxID=1914977 RepID=UPI002C6D9091|nr:nucleotidyltransferase domain-containing protein [Undibacterium sp.]HTD05219.1 nucleotidyltransferase domain-containing protein [Undibacterium sp.]